MRKPLVGGILRFVPPVRGSLAVLRLFRVGVLLSRRSLGVSADDKAVTIGRMVVERKRLREQKTILDEAIRDYAVRVSSIGLHLKHPEPDETLLSNEELRIMESGTKINDLLSERIEVRRRYSELDGKLHLLGA